MKFAPIVRMSILAPALAVNAGAARADLPSGNFGGATQIAVAVDHDACRTGAVQCSGTGGNAPLQGNHVPVAIKLQALDAAGAPLNSIADANIVVVTKFMPAGGAAVTKRACMACFQTGGDGVYGIFVEPIRGQNWKSGTYFVQVQVTRGNFTARALTEIKIPF